MGDRKFVFDPESFDTIRGMAVATAAKAVEELYDQPTLDEGEARKLKVLVEIVNSVDDAELKRFLAEQKARVADDVPDPKKAEAIARGERAK